MKQKNCRYAWTKSRITFALVCATLSLISQALFATDPKWYAVQASATVQTSPAQIRLTWPVDPNSQGYTVARRAQGVSSWTTVATLPSTAGTYTDSNVSAGSIYEYQISTPTPWNYTGYGYVFAGINAPLVENRGKVLLVVDNTYAADLASELTRLQHDLIGDGWTVVRRDVSRNDSVVNVKNVIKTEYNADSTNLKSVFLFGHVPVPYSGDINPDGHPDHQGAWPSDAYYADMDGNWTDSSVNDTSASRAQNKNTPGDGKFDQSELPSSVELQIGRVDLANMTAIANVTGQGERALLRQYLDKDHNFRHTITKAQRRGLICDNFGESDGEAFAASGWRAFSSFFGANNVTSVGGFQFFPTLATQDYLWSYGCGGGSYYACYGVGQIEDFANTDIKSVFTMFLGSYFGDWDADGDFLRGALASKTYGLASAWAGRPHWFFQSMGLGATLGSCAKISQNNTVGGMYSQGNWGSRMVHVALMGDPTLRMHPVIPPSNVVVNNGVVTWNASGDSDLQGYHVYRATSVNAAFTRLTSSPVTTTSFTDSTAGTGTYTYMVRAIKLERSGSGTYFNASQGIFANGTGSGTTGGTTNSPTTSVVSTTTNIVNTSTNVVNPATNTVPTTTTNVPVTNTTSSAQTSATFVQTDTTTQGNWKSVYGREGRIIMGDTWSDPTYTTPLPLNKANWTWQTSTTDVRAPQKSSTTDRVAACWYSSGSFSVDLNFTDAKTHRVAVYCLDWDNSGRVQTMDILNADSGVVLNSKSVSEFGNGKYLVWDLKGHVKINFTRTTGFNAEVSAIFFDPTDASSPASAPITVNAPTILPGSGVFTNSVQVSLATTTSGASIRYTTNGSTPNSSSALYSTPFTLTASTTVKAVAFAAGTNSAVVTATFTKAAIITGTTNATPSTAANQANFIGVNTTTQGAWQNRYGLEGFGLMGFSTSFPSYAQVTPAGHSEWIWEWSTTDARALQKPGTTTDRVAGAWYSANSFNVDVNLTDGKFHRLALYCLDWDASGRAQTIQILDAGSGAILSTQTLSGFSAGKYLVWDLKGHVTIKVTKTTGSNAVVNGLFFNAPPSS